MENRDIDGQNSSTENAMNTEDTNVVDAICELDELEQLNLIKNRLIALNSLNINNNLTNLNEISQKYNIHKNVLIEDYFGIHFDDIIKINDFNEEAITIDLKEKLKEILNNFKFRNDFFMPNSLISIKYHVPFVFVNKLALYLANKELNDDEKFNNINSNKDNTSSISNDNIASKSYSSDNSNNKANNNQNNNNDINMITGDNEENVALNDENIYIENLCLNYLNFTKAVKFDNIKNLTLLNQLLIGNM